MANNVVNIYKFGDLKISPIGDIEVNNGAPLVVNGTELLHQEVRLLFKNIININNYLGHSAIGEEGAILGKIIQEDIDAAIASNDILKEINLSTDVYPLPDNKIKIDIYYTDDIGETIPVDGTVLDFTSGTASDISYTPPQLSDIYNIESEPFLQTEMVYISSPSTVLEIKHPPVAGSRIYIINPNSYQPDELVTNMVRTITETISDVTVNAFDPLYLDDIFTTLQDGSGNLKNIAIENLYFIDSDTNLISYILDGTKIMFTPSESYITDVTVVMQYVLCETHTTNYTIDENAFIIPEDIRIIFPYSRIFGKIVVLLPSLLDKGNYVAVYQRYPVR